MKQQRKFLIGAVALVGVVGYLAATGMRESMIYYRTPDELAASLAADPTSRELAVKVGGRVVPGTVQYDPRTLDLRFTIVDIASGKTRFPVHYSGPLPDTFKEGRDVVVTGVYAADGNFQASELLTKCGSRYEASAEDFKA